MSETPKCTSRWGHKFVGRYSEEPTKLPPVEQLMWIPYSQRGMVIEHAVKRTYERDICIRCGVTIEKPPANT